MRFYFCKFLEPDSFEKTRNCLEAKDFLKKARSLLVVVATSPTQGYEEFTKKVSEYNKMEPFKFGLPKLFEKARFEKVGCRRIV